MAVRTKKKAKTKVSRTSESDQYFNDILAFIDDLKSPNDLEQVIDAANHKLDEIMDDDDENRPRSNLEDDDRLREFKKLAKELAKHNETFIRNSVLGDIMISHQLYFDGDAPYTLIDDIEFVSLTKRDKLTRLFKDVLETEAVSNEEFYIFLTNEVNKHFRKNKTVKQMWKIRKDLYNDYSDILSEYDIVDALHNILKEEGIL